MQLSGGPRRAVAQILLCIMTHFCDLEVRANPNYVVFHEKLQAVAVSTIQHVPIPNQAADLLTIADAIDEGLVSMVDGETGRRGSKFGVAYGTIVWRTRIPTQFRNVVVAGRNDDDTDGSNQPHGRAGAATKWWCDHDLVPHVTIGEFGWPCAEGAVVQVQQGGRFAVYNCVIAYSKPRFGGFLGAHLTNIFMTLTWRMVQREIGRQRGGVALDLTRMALDFARGPAEEQDLRSIAPAGLQAVVIVPIFLGNNVTDSVGMAVPAGGIEIDVLTPALLPALDAALGDVSLWVAAVTPL